MLVEVKSTQHNAIIKKSYLAFDALQKDISSSEMCINPYKYGLIAHMQLWMVKSLIKKLFVYVDGCCFWWSLEQCSDICCGTIFT